MMRNHFPHKVVADIVGGTGGVHASVHRVNDILKLPSVQIDVLTGAFLRLADTQYILHLTDAFRLLGDDV